MNKLVAVFGDMSGWNERLVLSKTTSPNDEPVTFNPDHTFAKVEIGSVTLLGPVVQHTALTEGGMLTVVYLGREIPDWAGSSVPGDNGWRADEFPQGITNTTVEVDCLVVVFDTTGRLSARSKTIWLNSLPRQMERFDLTVDDHTGKTIHARVLEGGVDVATPDVGIPYLIVTAEDPTEALTQVVSSAGWEEEPWAGTRRDIWWELVQLTSAIETVTEPLMNASIVREVKVHDLIALNTKEQLMLLPRDVRDGLERTLLGISRSPIDSLS